MHDLMNKYLEWLSVTNYSQQTVTNRSVYLGYFIKWAEDCGICNVAEVTKQVLERYQRYLFHYRKRNGDPLAIGTQHTRLVPIRSWFKWLARNNHIPFNPAGELELPKLERRLPKHVLTVREAEQVLAQATNVRDRAILETLYSTGIRRMELLNLRLYDLDADRGTLMVRQGKGKKDRMVPIGERAVAWIDKYMREVRPRLLLGPADVLFVNNVGKPFTPNQMTRLVREYVESAEIGKRGSCHLFRHTMATLMLENGADVRYIQAMLGHVKLETTAIYTQVSIRKLKEIHSATHPAKRRR
jgi:integrase/recombinase XerD